MTATTLLPTLDPEVLIDDGTGDHDRYAHYCRKEDIVRAAVMGDTIVALCGKRWVPTRDPDRYPICPACERLLAAGITDIPD